MALCVWTLYMIISALLTHWSVAGIAVKLAVSIAAISITLHIVLTYSSMSPDSSDQLGLDNMPSKV